MHKPSRLIALVSPLIFALAIACSNSPEVSTGQGGDGDGDNEGGGPGDGDGDIDVGDGDGDGTGGVGDGDGDLVIDGCSDANQDDGEECDDGNLEDGDGCDAECQLEPNEAFECPVFGAPCEECGNGTKESTEECDDGNAADGDGCSGGCDVEEAWVCNEVGNLCNSCGNGIVEGEEACDDGNASEDPVDGCSADCLNVDPFYTCNDEVCALCGDGVTEGDEACDDGNNFSLDGCLFNCSAIEEGFTCEDGQAECQKCGNGREEGTEECDDTNTESGDGCDATCAEEAGFICAVPGAACYACGNGIQEGSPLSPGGYEQCDDGGACSTSGERCTSDAHCPTGETCDPVDSDGCDSGCQLESDEWTCPVPGQPCLSCGNGTIDGLLTDLIHEECDDGNNDADDGCGQFCQLEPGATCEGTQGGAGGDCTVCGDGTLDPGEGCDDDNRFDRDGCSNSCQVEAGAWDCSLEGELCSLCGNGIKEAAEVCDDGNLTNTDGCTTACALTDNSWTCAVLPGQFRSTCDRCGNGLIKLVGTALQEQCDDGNTTATDGCDASCNLVGDFICPAPGVPCNDCGNGQIEGTEKCDEGPGNETAGCVACLSVTPTWTCATAGQSCTRCGDNLVTAPHEKCDDGGNVDGDGCRADCKAIESGWLCPSGQNCTRCGNGQLNGTEECDDGNTNPNDGCNACVIDDANGWTCYQPGGDPTKRSECDLCGNGRVRGVETCDDGDTTAGDGCSGTCTTETNNPWVCPGAGGECEWCGSGALEGDETCDEGSNTTAGCVNCTTITTDWYCTVGQACTECGNGVVEGNEKCDDPGTAACASDCKAINPGWLCTNGTDCTQCGNSSIDAGEQCDDGNRAPGDGCTSTCQLQTPDGPYFCVTPGLPCELCGDGILDSAEDCDDGALSSNPEDGCDETCSITSGWTCSIPGVECNFCGNGIYEGAEQCDDGNGIAGDGCLSCVLEDGWACEEGGSCVSSGCGDGFVAGAEACDDGNNFSFDGCAATCKVESGFACPATGGPCAKTFCGDGVINAGEQCDLGGHCSVTIASACTANSGCPSGQTCVPNTSSSCDSACLEIGICGDGVVGSGEECDDGGECNGGANAGAPCTVNGDCASSDCNFPSENAGVNNGDGCDANCDWEDTTLACSGKSAGKYVCVAETGCGDGVLGHDEACDDDNNSNGDGCSSTCTIEALHDCSGDVTETSDCGPVLGWVQIRTFDVDNVNPEALHYDPSTRSFVGYKANEAQEPVELCIDGTIIVHPNPGTDPSVTGEICPPGVPLGTGGCSVLTTDDPIARYYPFDAGSMTGATYDAGSGSWYFQDASGLSRLCELPAWSDHLSTGYDTVPLAGNGITIGDDGRLYVVHNSSETIRVYERLDSVSGCDVGFDIAGGPVATYAQEVVGGSTLNGIFSLTGAEMVGTYANPGGGNVFRFTELDGTPVASIQMSNNTYITTATGGAVANVTQEMTGGESAADGSGFIVCFNANSVDCKLFGQACEDDADCERTNPGTVCRTEDENGDPIAAPYCWAPAKARNDYSAANTADTDVPIDVLENDTFAQSVCRGGNMTLVPDSTTTYNGTVTVGVGSECGAGFGANDECLLYTPPADGTCNIIDSFEYGSYLGGDEELFATVYVTVSCDCGNGVLDAGEQCDPKAPGQSSTTCSSTCRTVSICGNGTVEGSEQCDSTNRDVCSWDCKVAGCGDGTRAGSEQCDDGNSVPGDGCSVSCTIERCGNGVVEATEQCDDDFVTSGSPLSGDGCDSTCKFEPECGDGLRQGAESCDDGDADDTDGCRSDCSIPFCGDGGMSGYPLDPGEQCDDGNNIDGDGCTWNCEEEACGDGIINVGEDCDDGPVSSTTCRGPGNDPPSLDCTVPVCGDGVPDAGEECDASDGFCDTDCTPIFCGNGQVEPDNPNTVEACDDGNTDSGDGCSSTCELEAFCGDGAVGPGEECDYNASGGGAVPPQLGATCSSGCFWQYCGNDQLDPGEDCDGESNCRSDCSIRACGDGDEYPILDPGEQCDDGNLMNGDGCTQFCLLEPVCGNDVVQPGEECDDGGMCTGSISQACAFDADCPSGETCEPVGGDGCSATCELEGCGNGVKEPSEECDPGDPSTPVCRLDCTVPRCGDQIFDAGEECDNDFVASGLPMSGDGCDSSCDLETICGDGTRDPAGEGCDDGNEVSGDGCSSGCFYEYCGNSNPNLQYPAPIGHLDPGEQCDDGNNVSGDGCSSVCKLEPACGDGVRQGSEQCDEGGACEDSGASCSVPKWGQPNPCGGGDVCRPKAQNGCNSQCLLISSCGDGIVQAPEVCDPAHPTNGADCRADCAGKVGTL